MLELLLWQEEHLIGITFLLALCTLAQTLAFLASIYRFPGGGHRRVESLFELLVLAEVIVFSLMHGHIIYLQEGWCDLPVGYIVPRIAAFAAVAVMGAFVLRFSKKPSALLPMLAGVVLLPAAERILGPAFPFVFIGTLLVLLVRAVVVALARGQQNEKGLSALSVKKAVDALHSGLLFFEKDGFILLMNAQIRHLMLELTGSVQMNGLLFCDMLLAGDFVPGCRLAKQEGNLICLLPDNTAWMFAKTRLIIRHKEYFQLSAADVTDRWKLTEELRRQNEEQRQKSEELKHTLANLNILCREKEIAAAKMRAHDILGQRLSMILRSLQSGKNLDKALLLSVAGSLLEKLKEGGDVFMPAEELENIRKTFAAIGITLEADGSLPQESEKARLFVEVIRESVTNAVRHGLATHIYADMQSGGGLYTLAISNNGHLPQAPIVEGGGIGGMREKIKHHGGAIDLTTYPAFTVSVALPKGD